MISLTFLGMFLWYYYDTIIASPKKGGKQIMVKTQRLKRKTQDSKDPLSLSVSESLANKPHGYVE
jgi:hypothetical protein